MRLIDADALIEFCAERWIPLNIDAVNMQPTIQPEKAQLSKEGTTKDTTSDLPTVQPEPQVGHWILHESPDGGEQYECSECGVLWEFNDGTPEDNEAYFCPKCGAKMTISTK